MGLFVLKDNKSPGPELFKYWPWLVFTLVVIVYNSIYLKYGFNATDEGWLQTLGKRIADGEKPYLDFNFLITPLSIYVQAFLIKVFGDGYTILAARWYWAVQMWGLTVIVSLLYYRYVKPVELFVLMTASWVVSSLLLSFPWYNYDAVIFGALTIVLLSRKQYILAGSAVFLAFMSKQNYLMFLPSILMAFYALNLLKTDLPVPKRRSRIGMVIGFIIPLAAYMIYLAVTGGLDEFYQYVFIYPRQTSRMSVWFMFIQNYPTAFIIALPVIVSVVILFLARGWRWLLVLVVSVPVSIYMIFQSDVYFVYSIAFFNIAALVLALILMWKKRDERIWQETLSLFVMLLLLVVLQYFSGHTFSGIIACYTGAGVALPLSYLAIKSLSRMKRAHIAAIAAVVLLLGAGIYHKYNHIYRDLPREELTAEFTSDKLRGIMSTPRNVKQIDSLVLTAQEYTQKGEYIFVYPDIPVLYYLADRKNPTRSDWYYWRGMNVDIVIEAIKDLMIKKPNIIFIQQYTETDYKRTGVRLAYRKKSPYYPLYKYIMQDYRMERLIGDVMMYVPK